MNEEYAIEPTACATGNEARSLLKQFGPLEGRYVAEFPGKWKEEYFHHIAEWSEIERQRATRALDSARRSFVPSGREFITEQSWMNNLGRVQQSNRPFSGAVISRKSREECGAYSTVDDFTPPPSDAYMARLDAQRFAELARPLIRLSDEIAMVDPYFQISKSGHAEFLKAILSECMKFRCRSVIVWAKAELAEEAVERPNFRTAKESAGFSGCLSVQPVNETRGQTDFHDRYLLSMHGGLALSKGFQPSGRKDVRVTVLRGDLEALVKIFLERKHDLEMKPCFVV